MIPGYVEGKWQVFQSIYDLLFIAKYYYIDFSRDHAMPRESCSTNPFVYFSFAALVLVRASVAHIHPRSGDE